MNEELATVSCEIIAKVGSAKGLFVEAIRLATRNHLLEAEKAFREGETLFNEGHAAHGKLLSDFAAGKKTEVDLLLVHAECQMMSAEDFKVLAEETIAYKKEETHED